MTEIVSVIKTNLALSLEYVTRGFEVSRIHTKISGSREVLLERLKLVRHIVIRRNCNPTLVYVRVYS
jgi:hypothetical protein